MSELASSPSDTLTRDGRVLVVRISAGPHGTLDGPALAEIGRALRDLADPDVADPDGVGAVLLTSGAASFCTGGDVAAFGSTSDRYGYVRGLADTFHVFLRALVDCPVPTVAAVTGWAAGAGMSIVCATDLPVAGRSTRLRPAYPGIGFSPDGGMSWTLPRLVGAGRARHILLTDQVLDADAALAAGLVCAVVEDEEVTAEAERTAYRLAQGPTAALGRVKRLLASTWDNDLPTQLDAEAAAIATSAAGPEGAEGLAAFAERRSPQFHGGRVKSRESGRPVG